MRDDGPFSIIAIAGVALMFVIATSLTFCSHRPTRKEYWAGKGNNLIEQQRRDEISAWKQVEVASEKDKPAATLAAQLATEIRKSSEKLKRENSN